MSDPVFSQGGSFYKYHQISSSTHLICSTDHRVRTDLEKSLNLTLVLENSWNLKIVPFVLEFKKIALENVRLILKMIKYIDSFGFM